MNRLVWCALLAAFGLLTTGLRAETKVTVSDTHLCCGQCLKGVDAALKDVAGVKHTSSQSAKTIELVAESDAAAQKAIDALAAAGFYGKLDNQAVKFKDVAGAEGKVERAELAGVHNCCGACTQAIKKAIKVDGVVADTVKPKAESFVVEGNFDLAAVVKGLLDAGFYVQVKK
ncbi:MAG: hypothetical protein SFU86_03700 [Pirellulaceae bacterium]|nr:hypothetical protein [Pirellulaceae bacterium]